MTVSCRSFSSVGIALILATATASCGSSNAHTSSEPVSTSTIAAAAAKAVVVQVGNLSITRGLYEHWMKVGAATVNIPVPGRPPPKPVVYEPPSFAACIANLEKSMPKPAGTTAQLRTRCRLTFAGIRARILNFLITGYWLRGEAASQGIAISEAEARQAFDREKRESYPTAASFRRFQEASRQTASDLMFAVRTDLLSTKLIEKFTNGHRHGRSQAATIGAFNRIIRLKWRTRTDCRPGYVVPDCKQYKRSKSKSG